VTRTPAVLVVTLALVAAGCGGGGGGGGGTRARLESALDSSADAALDHEGTGNARHVRCAGAGPARFTCTVDIPLGPDVYRERYSVTVRPSDEATCWQARQATVERLTGRDPVTPARPHRLEGCFRR
jgi:hypothetical protein